MKKIQIKGKDYVPVNERILYFREQESFRGWQIITEVISIDDDSVLMKATIIDQEGRIVATGHGQEYAQSSFINKTSYVENCETSAVGRALGLLGIGIDTSIASFEEVANAVVQQDDKRPWLNQITLNKAIEGMNTMAKKEDRKNAYNHLDKSYKIKNAYRDQLLEIVETQDIKI